jgi:hypothetical protein
LASISESRQKELNKYPKFKNSQSYGINSQTITLRINCKKFIVRDWSKHPISAITKEDKSKNSSSFDSHFYSF